MAIGLIGFGVLFNDLRGRFAIQFMPDDTPSHSYEVAVELVELAPNAEVTVYPWKEQKDVLVKTINQVRDFLRAHQPATTVH